MEDFRCLEGSRDGLRIRLNLILIANIVTTSKALVTTSKALVTTSKALVTTSKALVSTSLSPIFDARDGPNYHDQAVSMLSPQTQAGDSNEALQMSITFYLK